MQESLMDKLQEQVTDVSQSLAEIDNIPHQICESSVSSNMKKECPMKIESIHLGKGL